MNHETNKEIQISEDYQTRYEACYDTALNEFLSTIEKDKQSFEHYLDDTPMCDADISKILLIAVSYKLMAKKAEDFHYSDDYDQIDYDFTKALKADLLDAYGWEL
jgi:hypothetical protein